MITATEGDNQNVHLTLRDRRTGAPVVLSGQTVHIVWSIDGRKTVRRQMSITNATSGIAQYRFADSDLLPGIMRIEFKVTDELGRPRTASGEFFIEVLPALSKLQVET